MPNLSAWLPALSGVAIGVIDGKLGILRICPAETARLSKSPGMSTEAREPALRSGVRASDGRLVSKSLISSMFSMGVMPQMASGENTLRRKATAPTSLPSM